MTRLPAGRSSTSMPGSSPSSSGSVRRRRPSPPGNSVLTTSAKCCSTAAKVSSKRCSTVSVSSRRSFSSSSRLQLEVGALGRELVETLLLGLVLLLGQRVHLAELLAAALEPGEAHRELGGVVALDRLGPGLGETPLRLVVLCTRAREVDVDRGQPLRRLHGCPAKLDLLRAEAAEVGPELGGALAARVGDLAKRGFEPLDLEGQGGDKPVGARRDPSKHGGIGVHAGRPRGRGGRSRCRCRLGGRPSGVLGPGCELFDLDGESTAPGLQLEQDGLGCLTREPELAASWIPADALGGHGRHGRGEQILDRDHRQLRDELTWIAIDQDDDGAEPCRPDPLDELERPRGVVREHRGSSMAERCSDGALGAGVDVEQGEGEPLPGLGELASRRRQPFALGQRLLECPRRSRVRSTRAVRSSRRRSASSAARAS